MDDTTQEATLCTDATVELEQRRNTEAHEEIDASIYHRVKIDPAARVSPSAGIVGDVSIGERACVLAGAQLRGDLAPIVVEAEANVQEGVIVHVDAGSPVRIGRHATIGHGAIIHGCAIGDNALIGMGAIVLNDAKVGADAVVAAGALVTQGTKIPPRSMAMGMPARVVRELSDEDVAELCTRSADHYLEVGQIMLEAGVLESGSKRTRGNGSKADPAEVDH